MIIDLLLEHRALVPLGGLVVAVLCLAVGWVLVRADRRGTRVARVLLAASTVAVLALTLLPAPGRAQSGCVVQFALPTWGSVELLANIALFVPVGLLVALAVGRPFLAIAAGSLLSVATEALQALAPGIGRACDTNDWLMNTGGAAAGAALAGAAIALDGRLGRRAALRAGD